MNITITTDATATTAQLEAEVAAQIEAEKITLQNAATNEAKASAEAEADEISAPNKGRRRLENGGLLTTSGALINTSERLLVSGESLITTPNLLIRQTRI